MDEIARNARLLHMLEKWRLTGDTQQLAVQPHISKPQVTASQIVVQFGATNRTQVLSGAFNLPSEGKALKIPSSVFSLGKKA
jgi:hypothetical protein